MKRGGGGRARACDAKLRGMEWCRAQVHGSAQRGCMIVSCKPVLCYACPRFGYRCTGSTLHTLYAQPRHCALTQRPLPTRSFPGRAAGCIPRTHATTQRGRCLQLPGTQAARGGAGAGVTFSSIQEGLTASGRGVDWADRGMVGGRVMGLQDRVTVDPCWAHNPQGNPRSPQGTAHGATARYPTKLR